MPEDRPLDYEPIDPTPKRRSLPVTMLVIVGLVALIVSILLPSRRRYYTYDPRVACASHLRQIGQGILLYAMDNGGRQPPDLQTVLATQQLGPDVFVCGVTSDTKPSGATPAEMAADLGKPGHCSYIYVGSTLTSKSVPACIAAIEDPGNHSMEGACVLYADGHANWEPIELVMTRLNDLNKGLNPPTAPVTRSAAQARQDYLRNWKQRMPALKSGVWRIPATQPAK